MTAPTNHAAQAGVDLSQFYSVFFDEAAEHLAEMERLLLAVDPAAPTAEELNAIFRAAHSVKGGAGTFGFQDMAEVTHEAETLLDRVRRHETTFTTAMVDALLAAGDVLKAQLARHRGQATEAVPAEEAVERIRTFLEEAPPAPQLPTYAYELAFPLPKGKKNVATLETVLADLRAAGTLTDVRSPAKGKRVVRLVTTAEEGEVVGLFAFAIDPMKVTVQCLDAPAPTTDAAPTPDPAPPVPPAESDSSYGFFAPLPDPQPDPGYGFFTETAPGAPTANAPERDPGRRDSDQPGGDGMRAGRRAGDKTVANAAAESASIRVSVEKVDLLINQVGELVITQAMLAQQIARLDPMTHGTLFNALRDLERNTRDLQDSVMSIRMLPMAFVFNRFPRMVRDLAGKLGKQVELITIGEGTELDKGLIEKVADPLMHLVRNAIDHGIETPELRRAAGKLDKGTIVLRAAQQGGNIIVEVSDDGAGLNRDKILAKARERSVPVADSMSDEDVWSLIFEAGFSTAEAVTDVSGRGVGMDVVKRNITELGGTVEIQSAAGQGTLMTVRLPLTLAIMDGMLVGVDGETYILPLATVIESLQPTAEAIKSVAGQARVIQVRADYLPVLCLRELHGLPRRGANARDLLVIVENEGGKTALLVDELLGQQQIVVKNLESNYRKVPGVSGATILGDGAVALILDVPALVRRARH